MCNVFTVLMVCVCVCCIIYLDVCWVVWPMLLTVMSEETSCNFAKKVGI